MAFKACDTPADCTKGPRSRPQEQAEQWHAPHPHPHTLYLAGKIGIGRAGRNARLVENREHPPGPGLNEGDALPVVFEVDLVPVDAFGHVFGLLELEDKVDKVLLELLVGVVDAELLEPVDGEELEAEDVEHRCLARRLVRAREPVRINLF